MANLIQNFLTGIIDADLTGTATIVSSPELANVVAVAAPDVMVLVLDPRGASGAPEIVNITAHTAGATTATIARGQEGTTARTHAAGARWINALTRDQVTSLGRDEEFIRDTVGGALRPGANVTITVDDPSDTITISSTDTNTTDPEVVRDTIATALRAGANVSIVHDDVADTITIASTDTNTTDPEVVRDTMGSTLVAGTGIDLIVDDPADTITIAATVNIADTEIMAIMGAF